jgi:VanZ family protein
MVCIVLLFLGVINLNFRNDASKPGFDKVLHFFGFFVLSVLLLLTFEYYKLSYKYVAVFLVALGIGILIEAVQLGIPGREFSLWDILADVLGIIVGSVLVWSFSRH